MNTGCCRPARAVTWCDHEQVFHTTLDFWQGEGRQACSERPYAAVTIMTTAPQGCRAPPLPDSQRRPAKPRSHPLRSYQAPPPLCRHNGWHVMMAQRLGAHEPRRAVLNWRSVQRQVTKLTGVQLERKLTAKHRCWDGLHASASMHKPPRIADDPHCLSQCWGSGSSRNAGGGQLVPGGLVHVVLELLDNRV